MRFSGTSARGIRGPIIKRGDDLTSIIIDSLTNVTRYEDVMLNDGDIVCITESVVAISQGNFATLDDIVQDLNTKFVNDTIGVLFPVLSRNRFALILKAIVKTNKKVILQLSYPADEVGNKLFLEEELYKKRINPYQDEFMLEEFRKLFPTTIHQFTNIDYIDYYQDIIGPNGQIILSNNPNAILKYTKDILVASVHNRVQVKNELLNNGGNIILGLDDILTRSVNNSGYNEQYGLLGSNALGENTLKLFPRDGFSFVQEVQTKIKEVFGKHLEVMIYGDGAFKDPRGGIWELCDPVVSPGYTSGLVGTPHELKLKYLANEKFSLLDRDQSQQEIKKLIKEKNQPHDASLGTTPRQIVDLLGSLADLVSGSGDKGTPFVLIQNYFTNYATE